MQACTQLLGWGLDPGTPLTAAVHRQPGGAEDRHDPCHTEKLRPPHGHLRYVLDEQPTDPPGHQCCEWLDDTERRPRRGGHG